MFTSVHLITLCNSCTTCVQPPLRTGGRCSEQWEGRPGETVSLARGDKDRDKRERVKNLCISIKGKGRVWWSRLKVKGEEKVGA